MVPVDKKNLDFNMAAKTTTTFAERDLIMYKKNYVFLMG